MVIYQVLIDIINSVGFLFLFCFIKTFIFAEMSFLEKFKGKTQLLKKDEVGEILG